MLSSGLAAAETCALADLIGHRIPWRGRRQPIVPTLVQLYHLARALDDAVELAVQLEPVCDPLKGFDNDH